MENTVLNLEQSDRPRLISKLLYSIDTVARLAALQNITVKTVTDEALSKLETLSEDKIHELNTTLLKQLSLVQDSVLTENRVSNKDMTKNVLDFMKLSTSEDMLNTITEEDIVEIYNLDCIQIFRNFKFYETTTYSLSDLILFDWSELYYRPSQVSQKIQTYINLVLQNDNNDVVYNMEVPKHMIKEIRANPIQLCEIEFKKIAPITDRAGRRSGLIVTCQAKSMLSDLSHEGIDFI